MTEDKSIDLIKAVYSLTDQLQIIANTLQHIEVELCSISHCVKDAGHEIANMMQP